MKLAAVRGLGGFRGPEASRALLEVYSSANVRVKRQVVTTLGERAETTALLRIAQSESDRALRSTAIVTLGRAGGRAQLVSLYAKADRGRREGAPRDRRSGAGCSAAGRRGREAEVAGSRREIGTERVQGRFRTGSGQVQDRFRGGRFRRNRG